MRLDTTKDIFSLSNGDIVSKRNLFDLIQYSKIENSPFWSGAEFAIANTPQQGINWVGSMPNIEAVIIKTRLGSYETDGWSDTTRASFQYSFKARNGLINFAEKANEVLLKQPQYQYPILLFTEHKDGWLFEGDFGVSSIQEQFVVLNRRNSDEKIPLLSQDDFVFQEGDRKYVTHLMAERNAQVVAIVKSCNRWICEICEVDLFRIYQIKYIEAHHKVPISSISGKHQVKPSDLALLCPNCHKAVHIHMKKKDLEYPEIKEQLKLYLLESCTLDRK